MKIRSTNRALAITRVAAGSAAAVGVSRLASAASDTVVLRAGNLIPNTVPALAAPGLLTLQRLAQGPGLGLAAGGIAGLGIAAGAVYGEEAIDLSQSSLWKRLLLKPAADTFNSGIKFRQDVQSARGEKELGTAFSKGAKAGWNIGSAMGKTAGSVQGGISGALLGLEMSGEALSLLQSTLQSTPLPPLIQQSLPLLVGGACLFAGQAVGSAVGGAVGSVVGGGVVGLGVGTYAAFARDGGRKARI